MLQNIPSYISIIFEITSFLTLVLFYYAVKKSSNDIYKSKASSIGIVLIIWLIIQAALALNNFYNTNTTAFPPKFLLLIFPPFITIAILFVTKNGRSFIDSLSLVHLTYLNIVRIPVELVLYWLCINKAVPELMTFAGRNFDILSGITAPFIAYFGLQQKKLSKKFILIWNCIALALLINIVINAVLSAPFAFQKFAFEQPNIAVLNFPFNWLPAFIVPVVLFTHLVSIRQLSRDK